jgi:hypothetical protein
MASSAWARPRFYAATLVSELADAGAGMAAAVSSALSNRDPLSLLDSRYGVYAAALAATVAWPAVRAVFTAAVSDVSCVLMKRRGPRFRHALFFSSPAFPHSLSFKKQKKNKKTQPLGRRAIIPSAVARPAPAARRGKAGKANGGPAGRGAAVVTPTQKQLDRLFKWNGARVKRRRGGVGRVVVVVFPRHFSIAQPPLPPPFSPTNKNKNRVRLEAGGLRHFCDRRHCGHVQGQVRFFCLEV